LHRFEPVVDKKMWGDREEWRVRACQTCGWWKVTKIFNMEEGSYSSTSRGAAAGSLKNLDLRNVDVPLDEVRSYLLGCYKARFELNPKLFEETVASVFRDLGFSVLVTAGTGDGGIDMLLYDAGQGILGVQVKRYADSINVSQIRELLGALVVNRLTKGIFVTTSKFQSGAARVVSSGITAGYKIELIDGAAFYEALKLSQRDIYTEVDVQSLIKRAIYTHISDSGTSYSGTAAIYSPDLVKNLAGPSGPQDDWP